MCQLGIPGSISMSVGNRHTRRLIDWSTSVAFNLPKYNIVNRYIAKHYVRCNVTSSVVELLNTLRPRRNGRHFADDIFKCIFLNENIRISIEISLKFVPKGPINNNKALVQIMAWRRSGGKPLSEPMMVILLTHICVTRPQWVKFYLVIAEQARLHRWLLCYKVETQC